MLKFKKITGDKAYVASLIDNFVQHQTSIALANSAPSTTAKPEPLNPQIIQSNWLNLAWRAMSGERSAEVLAWQRRNTAAMPMFVRFTNDVANTQVQRTVDAFAQGLGDSVVSTVRFIHSECMRSKRGESTITEQVFKETGKFIGSEFAKWSLGDKTGNWQISRFCAR